MAGARTSRKRAQAWVELQADDPEAVSARAVACAHLPAARGLEDLRRFRLFELAGPLPARAALEDLLHHSTQFYNPHKERCTVRVRPADAAPPAAGEALVLVWERGGERRAGAERWWLHETGKRIEVREGVVWALRYAKPGGAERGARELAVVRDRRHGLLCNPHSQEARVVAGEIPLTWIAAEAARPPQAGGEA